MSNAYDDSSMMDNYIVVYIYVYSLNFHVRVSIFHYGVGGGGRKKREVTPVVGCSFIGWN